MSKIDRFWVFISIVLVAAIVTGGIVLGTRYRPAQGVEIKLRAKPPLQGGIYVSGAVANPTYFPLANGDTIEALMQAAGGTSSTANLSGLRLYVPKLGEGQGAQKIDINRAEVWLLEALPGIGEALAQRIVDYRRQNGPFHSTSELQKVAGIKAATYEKIKDKITVTD